MNTYYEYEIRMGRFEFHDIDPTESISSPDIFDRYLETARHEEEIIYSCGDHLTADGAYHDVYTKAVTTYEKGWDKLTGYVVFLQCSEYDENENLVQAFILRSHAAPYNAN